MEYYLADRACGASRRQAGRRILEWGCELRVLKRLEIAFRRACGHFVTLLTPELPAGGSLLNALTMLAAFLDASPGAGLPAAANDHSLAHGCNAVFNSRASILLFRKVKPGAWFPHNMATGQGSRPPADSS